MIVVGIDPSLTGTAVCRIEKEAVVVKRYTSKPAYGLADRIKRFADLAEHVVHIVGHDPDLVLIEGYSYGSSGGQAWDRIEYGGILRLRLVKQCRDVREVSPSTLKLFAAGHGHADKTVMALAAYKRWGIEYTTDDEVDAYCLARFAEMLLGHSEPTNDGQRRAVESILNPKVKVKKRRKQTLGLEP